MEHARPSNRLAGESSPYLRQHAANPVDWFPWGPEALEKARREDKPILLSIGYSACHWCHVMAHESFETEAIARLMNEHFVNVKVDREERPDVDQIYMSAVQLMTGSGGWPLTVFLTPEGEPFYGGTYFPPEDRYNRPGFPRVLLGVAQAYRERRSDVAQNARTLIDQINAQARQTAPAAAFGPDLLEAAERGIASRYDPQHGGFGPAPKFPPAMTIDFLLRYHDRTGEGRPLEMAERTLERMALGGIYDQVGGGFHRYSTDAHWLVPHFEKMLYDNALLARAYLDAYRVTGRPMYRRIVEESLDFVVRELRDAGGGFYSTLDADSEGVEGKFYVWSREEFDAAAGPDADRLGRYFDVSAEGNFEGANILHADQPPEAFAAEAGLSAEDFADRLARARARLFAQREGRVRPGRDEKVLTDWNGLALAAFAEAAAHLGRDDYRRIAESNAEFLLSAMWDGMRLRHAFKDGQARFNGYLDDYAHLAAGLAALYELTFEERWIEAASAILERMIEEFWDEEHGGFFFTGRTHETLVARTKEFFDNATPSGNSVAADLLARFGVLLDRKDYREKAGRIAAAVAGYVRQFPQGFGRMLAAIDFLVGPSRELALVGGAEPFLGALAGRYTPRLVMAAGPSEAIALVRGRPLVDGGPAAYLCENYVCREPVTTAGDLERLLRA